MCVCVCVNLYILLLYLLYSYDEWQCILLENNNSKYLTWKTLVMSSFHWKKKKRNNEMKNKRISCNNSELNCRKSLYEGQPRIVMIYNTLHYENYQDHLHFNCNKKNRIWTTICHQETSLQWVDKISLVSQMDVYCRRSACRDNSFIILFIFD